MSLTNWEVNIGILRDVLVTVVEKDTDEPGGQHLAEENGVVITHEEHVFLLEAAGRLLRPLRSSERTPIYELTSRVDWLVTIFRFERDVFYRH